MTSLESSLATLIALSTGDKSYNTSPNGSVSKKRTRTEAFHEPPNARSLRGASPYLTCQSESNPTPPFSAHEAQTLIQEELDHGHGLSSSKQAAFHSALLSLKQTLNTSIVQHESRKPAVMEPDLGQFQIPNIALMQWMLQCKILGFF